MADFSKSIADSSAADMAAGNPGINMGPSGSMRETPYASDDLAGHDAYWRDNFHTRPYARADRGWDHYAPAYRYGATSAARHHGREWSEVERDLERDWASGRGDSRSTWQEAKDAVRDAWDRVRGRGDR